MSKATTPTNPEELVERVAAAIYDTQFPGAEWPYTAHNPDSWRDMGRAAIDATPLVEMSAELQAFQEALRTRIWNVCEGRGLSDERCNEEIEIEFARLRSLTGDRAV